MRIGIAAAAVLAFTLSLTCALAVTPFRPADENSHVGYVDELARNGRIPAVGEPVHPRSARPDAEGPWCVPMRS